jgi:hypothetical protein
MESEQRKGKEHVPLTITLLIPDKLRFVTKFGMDCFLYPEISCLPLFTFAD